jgi:hypothetical protein
VKRKKDSLDGKTNTVAGTVEYIVNEYSGLSYDAGNLPISRDDGDTIWNVGHVIKQRQNTFSVLSNLLKQSFVAGYTNRFGLPTFTAWRDTSDVDIIVHDNNIIVRGSIKNFGLTPLTNVYNNLKIDYAYDYGLNQYSKSYSVNFVDRESVFPSIDDIATKTLEDINSDANYWDGGILNDGGIYKIRIPNTTDTEPFKVGGLLVFPEMIGKFAPGSTPEDRMILENCIITSVELVLGGNVLDISFDCDVIEDTTQGVDLIDYYTEIEYGAPNDFKWKTTVNCHFIAFFASFFGAKLHTNYF